MSDGSRIEWTDATWNPVRGCTKVSPGCKHCYAETLAERWRDVPGHPYERGFDPRLAPEKLAEPLLWSKPRRVFVNSMSDLFQDEVPDEYIAACFAVMCSASWHTYQILTKRAERLPKWFAWIEAAAPAALRHYVDVAMAKSRAARQALNPPMSEPTPPTPEVRRIYDVGAPLVAMPGGRLHYRQRLGQFHWRHWPLSNVQIGVSVEDRRYGLPRIEHLRKTPAALRFLSIEPLLEDLGEIDLTGIGWVIVGGESGAGAREMDERWVMSIRDQCLAAKVPFFFKQWGGVRKKIKGRLLDGRTWDEMPPRAA